MPIENILIEVDPEGNGRFETGRLTNLRAVYDFVLVADEASEKRFVDPDTFNKVAENRWEGHVEDAKKGVRVNFRGLESLDIEVLLEESDVDGIRFVVNGESKGKRKKFKIEPVIDRPAPLALLRVYILSGKPRLAPHQKVLIVHRPLPGPLSVSPVRKGVVE